MSPYVSADLLQILIALGRKVPMTKDQNRWLSVKFTALLVMFITLINT